MFFRRAIRLVPLLILALGVTAADLAAQAGSVMGQVTNAATGQPLVGARLLMVGSNTRVTTDSDGRYRFTGVQPGERTLRVNVIGFSQQSAIVTVLAVGDMTVDFALNASAIRLEEIVVSAVSGREKRARELGTNVASIDVKRINPATVTSVSDILSGRSEGVILQDVNGTAGTAQRVRIRGANSLSLTNEPLVYVDGVLTESSSSMSLGVGGQESSRLNDLNPNDIENIEIVKGPAAAALYGTAAANGVLLITTKRGRSGAPEWNVYAELGQAEDVTDYPLNYMSYQVIGNSSAPLFNPTTGAFNSTDYSYCTNRDAAAGACTQDGTASFNTLMDSRTTPFSTGAKHRYGVNVRGGGERVTYYLSSEIQDEVGVIDYNTQDKVTVRANLNAAIQDNFDIAVSTGYSDLAMDFNSNDNSIFSPILGGLLGEGYFIPVSAKPADALPGVNRRNYGFGFNQWDNANYVINDDVNRLTIATNAQYRPLSWLSLNANGGMDLISGHTYRTLQAGLLPIASSWENGFRESHRKSDYTYTLNASGIATAEPLANLISTTTVGGSYNRDRLERTTCYGSSLVQGTASCGTTAALFSVDEDFSEIKTIGAYVQTELAWKDRLFVAGAVRGDDNSAFGADFGFITYPSASVSWVLGEEPWFPQGNLVTALRLRAAYGQSGLRPDFRDAVTLFNPVTVARGGEDVPGITVDATGNLELEPEKSTEYELGLDAALFDDRVGIDFTYFHKKSQDALIERRLPPSYGVAATQWKNLGEIKNAGTELAVRITALDQREFGLDLHATLTTLSNEVVEIGLGVEDIVFNRGLQRHREGYSAGSFFQKEVTWNDADGNGLLTNDEVSIGDEEIYVGPALPTWQTSLSANVRLFDWLHLSSLVEFRGGNYQANDSERFRCGFRSTRGCAAVGNPEASLEDQATYIGGRYLASKYGYIEKADFGKWRELSATLTVPEGVARSVPAFRGMSLTLAGRNLATWTNYPGLDPETVEGGGSANFSQSEFNTQPPIRYFMVRLNYTF